MHVHLRFEGCDLGPVRVFCILPVTISLIVPCEPKRRTVCQTFDHIDWRPCCLKVAPVEGSEQPVVAIEKYGFWIPNILYWAGYFMLITEAGVGE